MIFYVLVKTKKVWYLIFLLRKRFGKKGKILLKSYFLRFIVSVRLMNGSSDSIADNLKYNLYNTKCKHCIKYNDCKKCEKCKDSAIK